LGYFKGHDFFKSYFSQVTQKDLQNNFGWDRCFQYKPVNGWYEEQHPVLFFLETPIPFQTAYRPSLGHGDGVQPGMVLLPERGIGLNMKFIHSLKPNKTGDKPKDPELLEKEVIAIDAFKHRFLQKSFSTSVMNAFIRPFFSNKRAVYYFDDLRMEANPFSCSPMLQGKEDFWIYTPEYPFLNFFFHYWTTQRSLIEKVDDLRGGEDIPYHYLKGKTPRQILYTREKDKQLFHNVLCIMAEDLLARLTVGISRDQFYDFYQEFQQQNGPIVTLEELAIQMQHHTGSNLMSVLKEWYAMPFSAKIQVQDCKLITYNNAKLIRKNTSSSRGNIMEFGMSKIPAYQMKNKTARAKFRNDGSTRGVITVHYSTFGDEGEHHERTFSFFIEPGEAKEISYTGALNNWIINMGTSNFQPVKFSEKSTMKLVKQEQGLVQKEAAPDTSFQIKTIEPTSLDQQITGVFIVDDEDSRFQVENKERILQKLFRKDLGLNSFTYASAMRSDITRWTHQTTGNAYGKYAKSFHYKMGGDGDFKAKWKVNLDKPGKYEIQALLYDNLSIDPENNTIKYHYTIQHKGKKYPVDIELQQEPISSKAYNYQPSAAQLIIPRNGTWVSLGSFDFPSGEVEVILSDKGAASHRIIADAVKWVRVDEK